MLGELSPDVLVVTGGREAEVIYQNRDGIERNR